MLSSASMAKAAPSVVNTVGNSHYHVVLCGGSRRPNYEARPDLRQKLRAMSA